MPRNIGIVTAADSRERSHGQLHIYDGEGKGKSQAALGVVLRTIGLGICEQRRTRVLLLRFLKGPGRAYDEDAAIEALQQGFPHLIDHLRTGRADHFTAEEATRFDREEAQRGWVIAKGAIASALYSVVVLDELNPVLDLRLLDVEDVVNTLRQRPEGMEIIVTGRAAPAHLVRVADLHSEMRAHRRPGLEEERVSPSKTSRRRTSRETWETSAMVTIIHFTFANLTLTQSCILAFVGVGPTT